MKKDKIKTDCFGYNAEKHKCSALTKLLCANGECNFYKTRAKYEEDIKKADEYNKAHGIQQRR